MAGDAQKTQKNAEAKKVIGRPFAKGNPGRPPGVGNHLTRTVKETVLSVFQELQGDPKHNLKAFAQKYPRDFYNIAAKLIPQDMKAEVSAPEGVTLNIIMPSGD
jgi:hypothetical protein